jgi:glucosylceramidase
MIAAWMTLILLHAPETAYERNHVDVWLTTADRSHLLAKQSQLDFMSDNRSDGMIIEVNPDKAFQTMDGFGAAVTGSSAYLMNHKMTVGQRESLLRDLFTDEGIRLSFVRHTIGASDYSVDSEGRPSSYTYNDIESGTDYELSRFSIGRDSDVTAVLRDIVALNGEAKVLGTPWTAPPWMKFGERTYNGWYLNYEDPRVYEAYANYFVKYIRAYKQAGVPIHAITVQNEPGYTTRLYPSMSMGAPEQAKFIRDYLGPAMEKAGLKTKIIAFDHNWDEAVEYASTVLGDEGAGRYIDGTAYHCYAGTPDAMAAIYDDFPDKHIYFTECSGGSWSSDFGENLKWAMSNLIIGAPRNWAKTVLMWNVALDPAGGPTNGGCSNCRGVVTIDPASGAVTRNVEYYALGHAAKFVRPGAVRIESTNHQGRIESVAYRNSDGSIVLVAANTGAQAAAFSVRWGGRSFGYVMRPASAATFSWRE